MSREAIVGFLGSFAVLLAGCQGAPTSAAKPGTVTSSAQAIVTATPTADSATAPLPGVVDDCTMAPPRGSQVTVRPTEIVLTCADAGIGLQSLTWASWSATEAAGTGLLWAREYAGGPTSTVNHYTASVNLSAVTQTLDGAVFTRAAITFSGTHPTWTGTTYVSVLPYNRRG